MAQSYQVGTPSQIEQLEQMVGCDLHERRTAGLGAPRICEWER